MRSYYTIKPIASGICSCSIKSTDHQKGKGEALTFDLVQSCPQTASFHTKKLPKDLNFTNYWSMQIAECLETS